MKNLIKFLSIVFVFIALSINVEAQKQNKLFSNDTIASDTTTYISNYKITGYQSWVVSFAFTKVDVADSLAVAKMQGSQDNTNFVDLTDATAKITETTTDGTTVLYLTNPKFLYYRGFLSCASGDSVAITNARFIIKED